MPFMLCNFLLFFLPINFFLGSFFLLFVYQLLTLFVKLDIEKKNENKIWVEVKQKNKSTFYNCNVPQSLLSNECSATENANKKIESEFWLRSWISRVNAYVIVFLSCVLISGRARFNTFRNSFVLARIRECM